jgi:hypothetical protein
LSCRGEPLHRRESRIPRQYRRNLLAGAWKIQLSRADSETGELLHAVQDCLYLAVAIRAFAPLVTADRAFHERALPLYKKISLPIANSSHPAAQGPATSVAATAPISYLRPCPGS